MPGVVVIVQGEVFRSGTCRGSTCMSHGPGSAQGTRVTNGPINEQIQAFRSIQELAIDHLGALGWNVTTCVDVVSASRQRAELVQSHWASRVARCGLQVRPRVAATQMEARIEVLDSAEQHLGSLAGCAALLVRADLILKQPLQLPRPRDEEREAAGGAIRFPFAMRGTMNGRTQTLLGNPRVADCFVWVPAAHLAHFRRILTEHRSEAHAHDFVDWWKASVPRAPLLVRHATRGRSHKKVAAATCRYHQNRADAARGSRREPEPHHTPSPRRAQAPRVPDTARRRRAKASWPSPSPRRR